MKITIFAIGSRGDVQPYVALGKGLKDAGHAVQVLTSQDFKSLVEAYNLEFVELGGNIQNIAQSMQDLIEKGNFLQIMRSMGAAAQGLASQAARSGLIACRDSDLIVGGLGGLSIGLALAEKLGLPFIPAYLYPFTPTRQFPSVLTPLPQSSLIRWMYPFSHRLAQQVMWQTTRAADNQARKEVLGMARAPFWGPFAAQQKSTVLYGYSPQVVPPPADWGESVHVTGYWFLDPPLGWQPPADLADFIENGPPPIFIGFGSMPSRKPEAAAELVVQALSLSGQRGVLLAGWSGMQKADLPESVFMTGSVPFSWLFPKMKAVVHHGGAGTTSAGCNAGIPAVVTPFMGDQPFWAKRMVDLGVGPQPIPRRVLTAERLAKAIRQAVEDEGMRAKARALGERVRAEDGVRRAVEVIEGK
jgi:sterol 3beta-glucosyltransferase